MSTVQIRNKHNITSENIPLNQKRLEKQQVTSCIHPFGGHVPQDLLLKLVTAI